MKTFWTILAIVFFLCAPFWYGYVIYTDLAHPEVWDEDWMHDPRIYLPLMLVVFPLLGWVWRREYVNAKRRAEEKLGKLRREIAIAREDLNKPER